MPVLNLGTGSGQHGDVANATALWIGVGGIGIDTALHYEDEAAIAAGIRAAKADPASLFITSKVRA
jgi:diketogulonate reductase-like aldo/keto reductase